MSDDQLLQRFESCTLAPEEFSHRQHVRVAWIYFQRRTPADAIATFCASLKKFAASQGKHQLYHETITWAFLLIIRDRMARTSTDSWDAFARDNADLLTWKPSVLDRYYRSETLQSELARRHFLFPDQGS